MVLIVSILVIWIVVSVPVALVIGRVLRSATGGSAGAESVAAAAPAGGSTVTAGLPPQRGSGAGPRAA